MNNICLHSLSYPKYLETDQLASCVLVTAVEWPLIYFKIYNSGFPPET